MAFDVSFIYRIIDKYTPALRKMRAATSGFKGVAGKALGGINRFGGKLREFGSVSNSFAAAMGVAAMSLPLNKFIRFEDAVGDLDKVFNFKSAGERQAFIDDLTKMAPILGLTRVELSKVAFQAGKLGIAQDEVAEFARIAAEASVAFDGLAIENAGQIIGELRDKFGLANEGVDSLLDAINTLADSTTRDGGEILTVLGRMSGEFNSLGFPPELAAGFSTFARQISQTDELAASGLKQMIAKLIEGGRQAQLMADPLGEIRRTMDMINNVPEGQRGQFIIDNFGLEARQFVTAFSSKMDLFAETMGVVADKSNFAGSKQSEFARKMAQTSGKLLTLNSHFQTFLEVIGAKLAPTFNKLLDRAIPLVGWLTEWVEKNPKFVKFAAVMGLVVAAIVPLAGLLGLVLLALNPISFIVLGIGAAFTAAGAAVWAWWTDVQNVVTKVKAFLAPFAEWMSTVFATAAGFLSDAAGLIGFGGDDQARDLAAGNTAQSDIGLNGNIDVRVNGPGKVERAEFRAPGNLGTNVASPVSP